MPTARGVRPWRGSLEGTAWSAFHGKVASRGQHATSPGSRAGGQHSLTSAGSTVLKPLGRLSSKSWTSGPPRAGRPASKEPCPSLGQQTRLRTQPALSPELLPAGRNKVVPAAPARPWPLTCTGASGDLKPVGDTRSLAPFRSLTSAGTESCREQVAARRRPSLGDPSAWGSGSSR